MTFKFMPNLRRWAFQWVARHAVPMLHSAEVKNQVQVLLFDEDDNEISSFNNVPGLYTNVSPRACYFHRGTLKLQSLHKNLQRNHNVDREMIVNHFEAMWDVISDDMENEREYKLIFSLAKVWIDQAISHSFISPLQST